jgi:DnaJ family protein C protein 17
MANDDLKQHITSSNDFYALLNIPSTASEAEIRSGWRKTALKHHPDKVGATPENLEKFHLLQIAFDVLSDESTKEQYDNARRAREQKAQRSSAYDAQRKAMIDKLEKGERDHKRSRGELDDEETEYERKLARLAADGKRRREERTEKMRQEALEEERRWAERSAPLTPAPASNAPMEDKERSVTLRFRRDDKTAHLDRDAVQALFSHFGAVEHTLLRDKKRKVEGEKHKVMYCSGLVVFGSIMGALAAVVDFPKLKAKDPRYAIIEEVDWADRPKETKAPSVPTPAVPATPESGKIPKFSFKGGSAKSKSATIGEDEKARLRAAEIERMRREDEEEDAAAAAA